MEDVCDLSHLLQTEHHEKEKLEKMLSEMDSTLEIETRRLQLSKLNIVHTPSLVTERSFIVQTRER